MKILLPGNLNAVAQQKESITLLHFVLYHKPNPQMCFVWWDVF